MSQSAQEVASRWKRNLSGASEKIRAGIDSVTESPMEKAAASVDAYRNGVLDAINSGRFANGLRSVSLAEWKRRFKEVGVARIAQGASDSEGKVVNFLQKFLPQAEAISKEVQAMPKSTFDERLQRMVANAQRLHELKGTFKG